ncbi:hypothetical protein LTR94_032128, partial [Friedmanniomyces endolithicus]
MARQGRVERHVAIADIWAGAAEAAPAMGMVGTLIGLAAMFATMNDPQRIGSAMAIALLATLYGALLANLIAQPIATRLRTAARTEALERLETRVRRYKRRLKDHHIGPKGLSPEKTEDAAREVARSIVLRDPDSVDDDAFGSAGEDDGPPPVGMVIAET